MKSMLSIKITYDNISILKKYAEKINSTPSEALERLGCEYISNKTYKGMSIENGANEYTFTFSDRFLLDFIANELRGDEHSIAKYFNFVIEKTKT